MRWASSSMRWRPRNSSASARSAPARRERSSPRTSATALAALAVGAGSNSSSTPWRSAPNSASSASRATISGCSAASSTRTVGQLVGVARGVALQGGDDAGVEELTAVALQAPAAFDDHGGQSPRPLAQLLDAHQRGR